MASPYVTGLNPFLPLTEFIPDGEPHVFGDRIYLFGSHDTPNGTRYCAESNYVGWSAPLSNPTEWTCSGVTYDASQDPLFTPGETNDLYAPDVVRGNDGRYYMYYNFVSSARASSMNDGIGVAVCDTPDGRYEYYGRVKNPDGSVYNTYLSGDPAVINDDGVIRLYCGWSLSMVAAAAHAQGKESAQSAEARQLPKPGSPAMKYVLIPVYQMMFHKNKEEVEALEYPLMGANCLTLADDMLTVTGSTKRIVPGQFDTPEDSSFFGHAFYEASSIRKIGGRYYFIYSSENSNELCYATSEYPDHDFVYGGTIISNGDVGFEGRKKEDRLNFTANDHGSLECINGQWYIFHHRQTRKCTFSRQSCAEKVTIDAAGRISQVECTSMGLREGLLPAEGSYPASCCCSLTNGHMPHCTNTAVDFDLPCVTDDGKDDFVGDISEGTVVGYKYFDFTAPVQITLTYRSAEGCRVRISDSDPETKQMRPDQAGEHIFSTEVDCPAASGWTTVTAELNFCGKAGLFIRHIGGGKLDLKGFELTKI